jgi:formamidopyrimidine-DNA glycosylase
VPELPEVETIVRSLRNPIDLPFNKDAALSSRPGIVGRTIKSGDVTWLRSLAYPSLTEFQAEINGQRINGISRRGKFIILELGQKKLLIHLRMSGDILVENTLAIRDCKHDRVILWLDGGRVWLVDDEDSVTGKLGPEPFDPELTPEKFFQKIQKTRKQTKPLLLDQTFLAGMGNIYTDEALFDAGIHPETPASRLTEKHAEILLRSIKNVLQIGIEHNGASIDWVYRGGGFQNYFKVYQRSGKPCFVCGTLIKRAVVGQRGTYFCPNCQPFLK